MAITPDNFLNIGSILINEVIGDVLLAIFIGAIYISIAAIKYELPLKVTLAIIAFFGMVVLAWHYVSFILGLIVLVLGAVIVTTYQNYLQKQNN